MYAYKCTYMREKTSNRMYPRKGYININQLNLKTMKKVKFSGKLSLNKQTVTELNKEQMQELNGGKGYHVPSKYENGGGSMAWAVGTRNTCDCEGFSCPQGIPSKLHVN